MTNKLKVGIIGSGNIGTDLLVKVLNSKYLDPIIFAGRNIDSKGLLFAKEKGVKTSERGIDSILENENNLDILFDATSAISARKNWSLLNNSNICIIDMTPAKIGKMCVPLINIEDCLKERNVNMITCGGQASLPIIDILSKNIENIEYIEISSSISSKSAGPATRENLDEYIETTESAIKYFSNIHNNKVILNLNPAYPCIDMQTSISVKSKKPDMDLISQKINERILEIKKYVPGYKLVVPPIYERGRVFLNVKVQGLGDYLPKYAGNLDIINCAAIYFAEEYSKSFSKG